MSSILYCIYPVLYRIDPVENLTIRKINLTINMTFALTLAWYNLLVARNVLAKEIFPCKMFYET